MASPPKTDTGKAVGMLEEVDFKVEMFNRLTNTCFNKCVEKRYKEGELYIGENTCIDRCVAKYTQVTGIIGQILKSGRHQA